MTKDITGNIPDQLLERFQDTDVPRDEKIVAAFHHYLRNYTLLKSGYVLDLRRAAWKALVLDQEPDTIKDFDAMMIHMQDFLETEDVVHETNNGDMK